MKIGIFSAFTLLFVMYGTNCSAVNTQMATKEYQNQKDDAARDSADFNLDGNYQKRGRYSKAEEVSFEEQPNRFGRKKRRRKMGIPQGTESSIFREEVVISKNTEIEPTTDGQECEVCKHQNLSPADLAGMEQFKEKNIEKNSDFPGNIKGEPTDDVTPPTCEVCKAHSTVDTDSVVPEENSAKFQKTQKSVNRNYTRRMQKISDQGSYRTNWKSSRREGSYIAKRKNQRKKK